MIITKLQGGLGNQMFQYAVGKFLAEKNNAELKLDISNFGQEDKKTTPRKFELKNFNINTKIATREEIKYFKKYKKSNIRFFRFLYNKIFADDSIYISQKSYYFDPEILKLKDNIYLNGEWQSEKYFKNIRNILTQEFTPKIKSYTYEKYIEKIQSTDSISIHIRRGDYLNKKLLENYGICSLDYYNKAIKLIIEKISNPTFFIFSDDIEWVKENLKIDFPTIFVSNGEIKDYEELILMSKCKHNIIANSSFSWWGAWLNQNPNKIVIAPKNWFKNESWAPKDLIPENWLRI